MSVDRSTCPEEPFGNHKTIFGVTDLPEWEGITTGILLSIFTFLTIVGNVLVVLSVFTYKPLRNAQNFFIVSLAVADLTVALLVLPFNVVYAITGKWTFGIYMCEMWLTADILCCTASILNLCGIALDRFWAITDPINYAQKRTLKRVLGMIAMLWTLSLVISVPPLIGWNDWPSAEIFSREQECTLSKRKGYVIYSSMGSFYIPFVIMTVVYIKIFLAARRRLRERARAANLNMSQFNRPDRDQGGRNSVSSETVHNEHSNEQNRANNRLLNNRDDNPNNLRPTRIHEDSLSDLGEHSSASNRNNAHLNIDNQGANSSSTTITITSSRPNPVVVLEDAAKKEGFVHQFIKEKQRISLSKERKAARTLGIIMGVFGICWTPFFVMYVVLPFCTTCCPSRRFVNFITWLGYINSFLNPIIYTIYNIDFRRAFRRLLGLGGQM